MLLALKNKELKKAFEENEIKSKEVNESTLAYIGPHGFWYIVDLLEIKNENQLKMVIDKIKHPN